MQNSTKKPCRNWKANETYKCVIFKRLTVDIYVFLNFDAFTLNLLINFRHFPWYLQEDSERLIRKQHSIIVKQIHFITYNYGYILHLTTRRSINTNTIQCNNSAIIIGATSWKQFTGLVYTLIGHIDVGDGRRKCYPLRTAPTG
jgi:hypothetical protein